MSSDTLECNSPVLFFIFNRMSTTEKVFEKIREAKPTRLYIASDGPRTHIVGEKDEVSRIREYVLSRVDWDCDVSTLFRDSNLGCKLAISSGIDWFFKHEEEGIILEDDCVPDASLFEFFQEMLSKYRHDDEIGLVTGTSYLFNEHTCEGNYFKSTYTSIWGWATWKRVWQNYKVDMSREDISILKRDPNLNTGISYIDDHYIRSYEKISTGELDTWDYQLTYLCKLNNYKTITPVFNLVSNIGVVGTRSAGDGHFIDMPTKSMTKPYSECNHHDSVALEDAIYQNVFFRFISHSYIRKSNNLYKFARYIKRKIF